MLETAISHDNELPVAIQLREREALEAALDYWSSAKAKQNNITKKQGEKTQFIFSVSILTQFSQCREINPAQV